MIEFVQDFSQLLEIVQSLGQNRMIVTDETVAALYGNTFSQALQAPLLSFPSGEDFKTRKTKEWLEDRMLEKGIERDCSLIALGGGVVTDMGGFIASTYCRGIPLFLIPTTLMGMVDAALGGKNGVNTKEGKNRIGTFYLPQKILIAPLFLSTLPSKEIKNGLVEMIKHGLIAEAPYFFTFQEKRGADLNLEQEIRRSVHIKMQIVQEDFKDLDKRHLLNYGHTVGHAIENASDYKISHGEAVAIGILVESYISYRLHLLPLEALNSIWQTFNYQEIPLELPSEFDVERMKKALLFDKKTKTGQPRFILLKEIGVPFFHQGRYSTTVDSQILQESLDWMMQQFIKR